MVYRIARFFLERGRRNARLSTHHLRTYIGERGSGAQQRIATQRTIEVVTILINTKFLVKVNRSGARIPVYVQRIDRTPIETTTNRKLALVMGRFTAEDTVKSIRNSRCSPELVSVQVRA